MSYPLMPRKLRKVGAPLAAIIALATLTALLLLLVFAVNPVGAVIGVVLTTVAMSIVVGAYLWLDRWEPEPPRLLIMAFLWGASVAILISLIVSVSAFGTGDENKWASTVIGAPLIEEAAKGLFLLIMMTGRRRFELNSLTDCLVFGGLVGAGFGWIEDIFYIASGTTGQALVTAAFRLTLAPFAHSLFTSFFAIGVYFALNQRSALAKVGCVLLGYLGAVLMHALWNGSAAAGIGVHLGVYAVWMVPVFATMIVLAVKSRQREQRVVAENLPGMIEAGLITPGEAAWLGSMRTRNQATAMAKRFGKQPHGAVRTFGRQVVTVAFVRDRIDRGFGDDRINAVFNDEVQWLRAARVDAAPALAAVSAFPRPPMPLPPPPGAQAPNNHWPRPH